MRMNNALTYAQFRSEPRLKADSSPVLASSPDEIIVLTTFTFAAIHGADFLLVVEDCGGPPVTATFAWDGDDDFRNIDGHAGLSEIVPTFGAC